MVWGLHASLFTLLGTLYAVFWNIEHAACFFFLKAYYTSLYIRYDPPFLGENFKKATWEDIRFEHIYA